MVRLDAFGSQVGLLVVIMRGAYLLESTVCKYRAREAFFESSINSGDTGNGNKQKTSSSCQVHNTDAQNCYEKCTQMPLKA